MIEFTLATTALSAVALLFVFAPLLTRVAARSAEQGRTSNNVKAYQQGLAELTAVATAQSYDAKEYESLKLELQQRLLSDTNDQSPSGSSGTLKKAPKMVISLVLLLVPIGSWLLYERLGAYADVAIVQQLNTMQQSINADQANKQALKLVSLLDQQLAKRADQPQYLMLLGRSHSQLQNYPAAQLAFQKLMQFNADDPIVLGLYAQSRYMAAGRQMDQLTQSLAERALELQPNNTSVLGLLGMAHFEQQNYSQVLYYWQQLVALLDPQSSTAQMIQNGIEQAKIAQTNSDRAAADTEVAGAQLQVGVSLSKGLTAAKEAPVFIYARAVDGSKMPLAVVRLTVADLPATIILDDSMAMSPSMKLSSSDQIEVLARISKQGIANVSSGDLEGKSTSFSLKSNPAIKVEINRIIP